MSGYALLIFRCATDLKHLYARMICLSFPCFLLSKYWEEEILDHLGVYVDTNLIAIETKQVG